MEAKTFNEFVSLKKTSKDTFETVYNPEQMGNAADQAYGGCAIAVALNAAFQTIPSSPNFHLYSTTGYFLGPSLTDRKLTCTVWRIRDTRTFATRTVEVSQDLGPKGKRKVLITTADFQTAEPATLLQYSAPTRQKYASVHEQLPTPELFQSHVAKGKISQKMFDGWKVSFQLFARFFESRQCREGVFAQTMLGIAKGVKTTQDHLALTDKTSADYFRVRHPLNTEADHLSAANFAMDGAIAFLPLSHNHMFLDDAGACSSLDFAFRVFSNRVNMNDWHLRELTTTAGAAGRTYSESRLWDLDGNMVASMTQQSIMRPPRKPSKM